MDSETKSCQNCKGDFVIEPEPFDFAQDFAYLFMRP